MISSIWYNRKLFLFIIKEDEVHEVQRDVQSETAPVPVSRQKKTQRKNSVLDMHIFYADPDPVCLCNADPDSNPGSLITFKFETS